jgi:RimJ/RimL family protein N-acetyltransferase
MSRDITSENIILENERVLLRPMHESDFEHLLYFSLNEPELWFYGLVNPVGEDNLRKYLKDAVKNRADGKEYPFIVFDKQVGKYAGSTRFYDMNPVFLTTQLGYTWYGKNFQRTGLNRHCKFLLFQFAFENWGLERVELRADVLNQRSVDAMKGVGCALEGILRSNMPNQQGGRRTSVVLSILKDEWFNGAKENLLSKIYH